MLLKANDFESFVSTIPPHGQVLDSAAPSLCPAPREADLRCRRQVRKSCILPFRDPCTCAILRCHSCRALVIPHAVAFSISARRETEKRLLPAELLLAREIVPCKKITKFSAKSN
jgi:hypothetical protein